MTFSLKLGELVVYDQQKQLWVLSLDNTTHLISHKTLWNETRWLGCDKASKFFLKRHGGRLFAATDREVANIVLSPTDSLRYVSILEASFTGKSVLIGENIKLVRTNNLNGYRVELDFNNNEYDRLMFAATLTKTRSKMPRALKNKNSIEFLINLIKSSSWEDEICFFEVLNAA